MSWPIHIPAMLTEALPLPLVPDYVGHLEERLLREFALAVDDWSRCVSQVTGWEDEHLLDNPTPELLARHKATLKRLLRFGQFISQTTEQPDFPNQDLTELVRSTQRCFQDKLTMWHGPRLSPEESNRILTACFPHES
jgi:hypothetical protein